MSRARKYTRDTLIEALRKASLDGMLWMYDTLENRAVINRARTKLAEERKKDPKLFTLHYMTKGDKLGIWKEVRA